MRENASHSFLNLKYGVNIDWSKAHIVFLLCWKILRKVIQEGIFEVYIQHREDLTRPYD